MKKILIILLLSTGASLAVAGPFKKVEADTTVDKNTLKKILHWVSAFTMYSSVDLSDKVDLGEYAKAADLLQSFVQNPELSLHLNAFRKATFVNVYPKGLLNGDEWILKKLNEISDAQYSTLNPPNLTLEVWFTPDATASSYTVAALFKTTEDKLRAAVAAANPALSSALLGKTYTQPRLAKADVNTAIFAALDALQTAIGSTFEPDIAIRYNDVMYLNNQTIEVWQKANEGITLQAVDNNNVLLTGALAWTNVVGTGNTVKFPIGKVGLERITLKKGTDPPISLLVKVKEFTIDLNSLLKKLLTEALSAKKKKATDTLAVLRQDSTVNARNIGELITELEKNNFPLENTGASLTPLFASPVTLRAESDTLVFKDAASNHAKSFAEIRKRKRIHKTMRHSINVAAVADLIVKDQSRMNTLLDDLVKNSGELIANLILGKDSKGQEDIAKSIVVDYLNKNLERLTGESSNDTQADPPLPLPPPAPPAAAPAFVATKYLYISPQVQFAGKDAFVKQLEDSLKKRKTPLYVFINYSQDVSTEAYLARAKGARPKGLPQDAKFVTFTLINIPGSVKSQVLGSRGCTQVASADIGQGIMGCLEGDDEGAMGATGSERFPDAAVPCTTAQVTKLKNDFEGRLAGKKFKIYGGGMEMYGFDGHKLEKGHLDILAKAGICDLAQFDAKFKYVLNDPTHDIVRDVDIIYSTVNLWEGLEAGYNDGSVDWESFVVPKINNQEDLENELNRLEAVTALAKEALPSGTVTGAGYTNIANYIKTSRENPRLALESKFHLAQTIKGIYIGLYCYASYTYSFADLKVRPAIKSSRVLWTEIEKAEQEGFVVPLSIGDGYKQYVAQYNTDKAYFIAEQYLEMVFLNQTLKAMNDMFRGLGIAWRNTINRQARFKMQQRRVDLEKLKGEVKSKVVSTEASVPKLGEKLNVSDYSSSAKNSAKDKMTPDHIPSFAAIKKSLETKLGVELTIDEAKKLYDEGTTLLYETKIHQTYSRTYGGRNSSEQILSDSKNLFEAAKKDMENIRKPLLESGASNKEIDMAFERIHEMNRKLGLYKQ
ncbi:MAG: hypothetical protein ACKVOQ_01475 [Cyclobacteriaceae bacterium]